MPTRSSRLAAFLLVAATTGCGAPAPDERSAPAAPAAPTSGVTPLADGGSRAEAPERVAEEIDAGPGYWRYTEPNGSLRFVQSLAEVPAAARATAERIATAGPRAAPAPRPRAPRAVPARPRAEASEPDEPARRASAAVVVYTTSWCGWCRRTRAWLDARGVAYENRDIERDPGWAQELQRKTGATAVPVIDVGGRLVRGFDPETLEELL